MVLDKSGSSAYRLSLPVGLNCRSEWIMPAAWSLILALRAWGLGSAWTSLHLRYWQRLHQSELARFRSGDEPDQQRPPDATRAQTVLVMAESVTRIEMKQKVCDSGTTPDVRKNRGQAACFHVGDENRYRHGCPRANNAWDTRACTDFRDCPRFLLQPV